MAYRTQSDQKAGFHTWPNLLLLSFAFSCLAAHAQSTDRVLRNPSVQDIEAGLFPPPPPPPPSGVLTIKGFTTTAPPDYTGACPAWLPDRPEDIDRLNLARRNADYLGSFSMPGQDAPKVNLEVQFETLSDKLTDTGKATLDKLAEVISAKGRKGFRFAVAGHADATGTRGTNQTLSCARALSVARYLVTKQIPRDRLAAYGYGSDRPIEVGVQESAINRRVEVRRVDD